MGRLVKRLKIIPGLFLALALAAQAQTTMPIGSWEDVRESVVAINPPGAVSAPSRQDDGTLLFSGSADEQINLIYQFPHGWCEGRDSIHLHLHHVKVTDDTGAVYWEAKWKWANVGATFPDWGTLGAGGEGAANVVMVNEVPDSGLAWHHGIYETVVSAAGKTVSSIMMVQLIRRGSTDPATADVKLLYVDLHILMCGIGSKYEYSR